MACVALPEALDAAGIRTVDFVKLDCEGGEYALLRSLDGWGFDRIGRIAMEYHPPGRAVPGWDSPELLRRRLEERGFEVEVLVGRHPSLGWMYARNLRGPRPV